MPPAADQALLPTLARTHQTRRPARTWRKLIRLGVYRAGTKTEVDEAFRLHQPLKAAQGKEEATSLAEGYRRLARIVAASETER
jgi:flagellum-specific ATP synthase